MLSTVSNYAPVCIAINQEPAQSTPTTPQTEEKASSCFNRCHCPNAYKATAIKYCTGEVPILCNFITCFSLSAASCIASMHNPLWGISAAATGTAAIADSCLFNEENRADFRAYLNGFCRVTNE